MAERFADDPGFSHLKMGFEDNTPLPHPRTNFTNKTPFSRGKGHGSFLFLGRFWPILEVLPGALSTVSSRSFVKGCSGKTYKGPIIIGSSRASKSTTLQTNHPIISSHHRRNSRTYLPATSYPGKHCLIRPVQQFFPSFRLGFNLSHNNLTRTGPYCNGRTNGDHDPQFR